jgi:hypothetical protein
MFQFLNIKLNAQDMRTIAEVNKIVLNYLKILKLEQKCKQVKTV